MEEEKVTEEADPKTQSEAEEVREGVGKVPGEGTGPAEAHPGETDTRGPDVSDSEATGTTPTEGGGDGTNVGSTGDTGGAAEGDGPTGGAV